MNDRRNGLSRWKLAVMLLAMALMLGPVMAGPKSQNKQDGGINPTNIAVIESDLDDDLVAVNAEREDHCYEFLEFDDAADVEDHDQIGARDAHEIATGRGIWVAVLDAGFNLNHACIRENLAPVEFDAIDGDYDAEDLGNGLDDDGDGMVDNAVGHGTFVAGMVLRAAPDAPIGPIRVMDDEGWGTNAELVRGIEFAIDLGVDVINLSIDQPETKTTRLRKIIREALGSGIVVVIAAGNDGREQLSEIAEHPDMVVACASDDEDRRAPFSNFSTWSSCAQIFAPGVDLYGPVGCPFDDAMGRWSGTSFSAGILSGAAALARQCQPWLSTTDIRNLLADSVVPVRDLDGREMAGTGRIDLRLVVWR